MPQLRRQFAHVIELQQLLVDGAFAKRRTPSSTDFQKRWMNAASLAAAEEASLRLPAAGGFTNVVPFS